MLSLRFVKKGILPSKVIKSFKLLLLRRTDVDYGDFDDIGKDEALDSLHNAQSFIETIEEAMGKVIL